MYLLLVPGLPRSFTTSLYEVLDKTNMYGSVANMKECPYLHSIYFPNTQKSLKYIIRAKLLSSEKIKTLDNYFLEIEKINQEHYIGVCDNSCYNFLLEEHHLQEIKNLSPYKIKIVLLFRDPIKHLYSLYCHNKYGDKKFFLDHTEWHKKLKIDYISVYNTFKNVFGDDMIYFVSEELFTLKEKQNSLEEFLDLPENCLNFNTHANKSNNRISLSLDEYEYKFKQLRDQYDQWENKFGYLPSCWGKL